MAKLQAFREFDWEGNEAWQAYQAKLEIPPGREAALERWKAKWFKREVDPDFDVDAVQSQPTPAPQQQQRPQAAAQPAPQPAAAVPPPPRAAPAAAAAAAAGGGGGLDLRRVVLAAAQAAMIVLSVVSVQPFFRYASWRAFHLFCRTAVVACGLQLFLTVGLPRFTPFPAALVPWLRAVSATSELFHLMLAGVMLQNPMLWLGVVPLAIESTYSLGVFLAGTPPITAHPLWHLRGAPVHAWLLARRQAALQLEAVAEVALGFQAVLSIFSMGLGGALPALVYWQQLRIRFWMPSSRPYHLQVWHAIGQRVQPLLAAVPFLRRYVDKAVAWFQQPGVQAGYGR